MEYKTRQEVPNEYKWNLNAMYSSIDEIESDIREVDSLTPQILEYKSHIMDNSNNLYDFLKLTEKQDRILNKLFVYSKMSFDVDTKDNSSKALKMRIEKLSEGLSEKYSFIEPEMLETDYETVLKYIDEKGAFNISKCDLIAYSNGGYYSLNKKIGKFGYSVQKNKKRRK